MPGPRGEANVQVRIITLRFGHNYVHLPVSVPIPKFSKLKSDHEKKKISQKKSKITSSYLIKSPDLLGLVSSTWDMSKIYTQL